MFEKYFVEIPSRQDLPIPDLPVVLNGILVFLSGLPCVQVVHRCQHQGSRAHGVFLGS